MTTSSSKKSFNQTERSCPKFRLFTIGPCLAILLTLGASQLAVAVEDNYEAVRSQFLEDLSYAQSKGVGISNYRRLLEVIDEQAPLDSNSQTTANKISSLHQKLKEQLVAVDSEGFDSLGDEIQSKLWKQLPGVERYWGTCLEFQVSKDSKFSHFMWIKHSKDLKTDKEVIDAFSRISLNKRSKNQAELPLKGHFSPDLYSYLTVLELVTGKEKYRSLIKFPCFKSQPY